MGRPRTRGAGPGGIPRAAEPHVYEAYADALDAYASGDHGEVEALADILLEDGPTKGAMSRIMAGRAAALHRQGRGAEALGAARAAVEAGNGSAAAHAVLGDVLLGRGDPGGALECYRMAERRAIAYGGSLGLRKAAAFMRLGRHEECVRAAGEALGGDDVGAAGGLAVSGLLALGRHEDALVEAGLWLAEAPGSPAIEEPRAMALAAMGRDAEALEAAGRAIRGGRARAGAWYLRARLLARLGRHEECLDALTVAASLDPQAAKAAKKERDLGPVRGSVRFRRIAGRGAL